jgi:hypothetical protein
MTPRISSTHTKAAGALRVFCRHRQPDGAPRLSSLSLWRVAQVVKSPLATGSDVVGGHETVAGTLPASATAHFLPRYVRRKLWTEEPDAVIPHVRSLRASGEQSPEVTRPGLLPLPQIAPVEPAPTRRTQSAPVTPTFFTDSIDQ